MLKGIDISKWQAGIDLSKIDTDFVICKATESSGSSEPMDIMNPYYVANIWIRVS